MNLYSLRKNFTATCLDQDQSIRGKLAFKTKKTDWLDTEFPVAVLMSVHSVFHSGVEGKLKMNALISIIQNHVKSQVTVLIADRAHIRAQSLSFQNNENIAFHETLKEARYLKERYQTYLSFCKVVFWHSYICQDGMFYDSLTKVKKLYLNDPYFRKIIYEDAQSTYSAERCEACADKKLFIEKSKEDLLEQCACVMVLGEKGYKYQFYPGKSFHCVEYVNQMCLPDSKKISWVDVFLTIEKKTFF